MKEKATFGAGCFWGVEAAFKKVPGVIKTRVGYTGGDLSNPDYRTVCEEETGHVEACEVTFDTRKVAYKDLLKVFWNIHDPTQKDRQGNDVGTQYRSVIFYHNEKQRDLAYKTKEEMEETYDLPIVTQIHPVCKFWEAEKYHRDYLDTNPGGYCHVDMHKVDKIIKSIKKGDGGPAEI